MLDQLADFRMRIMDQIAVAWREITQRQLLQFFQAVEIIAHVAVRRQNHRCRALQHVIAREQQLFFAKQKAEMI